MQNKLSWEFPVFESPQRKKSWYIWASTSFIVLILYAILSANFLFGLIIILASIIIFINHNRQIPNLKITINQQGIHIGNKSYDFKEIKKFWIIYEPPYTKKLYIDLKSSLHPHFSIPLLDNNPIEIRKFLKKHIEEDLEKESESTIEILEKIFKL